MQEWCIQLMILLEEREHYKETYKWAPSVPELTQRNLAPGYLGQGLRLRVRVRLGLGLGKASLTLLRCIEEAPIHSTFTCLQPLLNNNYRSGVTSNPTTLNLKDETPIPQF
jgi:hypothetical protein